jgi:hypothetical protein
MLHVRTAAEARAYLHPSLFRPFGTNPFLIQSDLADTDLFCVFVPGFVKVVGFIAVSEFRVTSAVFVLCSDPALQRQITRTCTAFAQLFGLPTSIQTVMSPVVLIE